MEHALDPPGFSASEPRRTALDAWLERQARRERRLVTLEDALLGNRARAYAFYRLRFFLLRFLCSAGLHIVRLGFLRFIFSHQAFLTTLVLNALASLVGSFWWGGLEVLRSRVRQLSRDAQGHHIAGEIGQWLTIAAGLGVVSLLLPAAWVAWELVGRSRTFDVLHLYVLAIGFRLGLDLVTLTFHSGVYAVRRVYRPLPAMMAVEIGGFAMVVALWPWLGRWSFPIAMFLSAILGASVIVRYAARLYRLLGWFPLRLERPAFSRLLRRKTVSEFLAGGTSYAVMKMDAFLMLSVFRLHTDAPHEVSLFMLFVAVAPAVQAGFDWAQLLYFDLKRLNTRLMAGLRRRYEQFAWRLAWLVGFALWGVACLLGTAITGRNLGELYWLIGPFFLCRSLLALVQIQAFAKQRYGILLGSGTLLLTVMLVLQVASPSAGYKLLGLAAASVLVTWRLRGILEAGPDEAADNRVLPLAEWMEHLSQIREPVRVQSLRFASEPEPVRRLSRDPKERLAADRWRHKRMAKRVARRLRGHGAVSVISPGRVAWYETARVPVINTKALLCWGGGLVDALASTARENNGVAALRAARDAGMLRGVVGQRWGTADVAMSAREVKEAFRKMVPQGVIYCPDDTTPLALGSESGKDRRAMLFEAVHFARHLQASTRRCRFDVTSWRAEGELRLIFIIDRRCARPQRTRWRQFITRATLATILAKPDAAGLSDTRPARLRARW